MVMKGKQKVFMVLAGLSLVIGAYVANISLFGNSADTPEESASPGNYGTVEAGLLGPVHVVDETGTAIITARDSLGIAHRVTEVPIGLRNDPIEIIGRGNGKSTLIDRSSESIIEEQH